MYVIWKIFAVHDVKFGQDWWPVARTIVVFKRVARFGEKGCCAPGSEFDTTDLGLSHDISRHLAANGIWHNDKKKHNVNRRSTINHDFNWLLSIFVVAGHFWCWGWSIRVWPPPIVSLDLAACFFVTSCRYHWWMNIPPKSAGMCRVGCEQLAQGTHDHFNSDALMVRKYWMMLGFDDWEPTYRYLSTISIIIENI